MKVYRVKDIDVILEQRSVKKWIFQYMNQWYFYTPLYESILEYGPNVLTKDYVGSDLRMYWLDVCLRDYIQNSWFKKTVREQQTILYRYGRDEIVNRGIRNIIRKDSETFKKFGFHIEDIKDVMKPRRQNRRFKTL